ncbi:MAG: nucleoside-diphosphate sugar epimerase [Thermoprotei archaeon]|nr:MAG: nucleoside-diphosphate sugar epimerase [Thermoprotei archaeon]
MMSVMVTGGAGFIGSFVVEELVNQGYKAMVYDNFTSGSYENLKEALRTGSIKVVEGDVRDYGALLKCISEVEEVVHLASLISVDESIERPELYFEVNAMGTLNVLRASIEARIKKLVYVSSAAVYGEPVKLPISEDHPLRPMSPYGASKIAAEALCFSYSKTHGLPIVILRPFNVYGPRQQVSHYSGVITRFIKAMLRGEEPVIYGDGEQTRDFIYVEDVAKAIVKALESESVIGEAINIAYGAPTSIKELLRIIAGILGVKPKARFAPPRKGDIRNSYADISKMLRLLQFKPATTLTQGLSRTINYFKEKL